MADRSFSRCWAASRSLVLPVDMIARIAFAVLRLLGGIRRRLSGVAARRPGAMNRLPVTRTRPRRCRQPGSLRPCASLTPACLTPAAHRCAHQASVRCRKRIAVHDIPRSCRRLPASFLGASAQAASVSTSVTAWTAARPSAPSAWMVTVSPLRMFRAAMLIARPSIASRPLLFRETVVPG